MANLDKRHIRNENRNKKRKEEKPLPQRSSSSGTVNRAPSKREQVDQKMRGGTLPKLSGMTVQTSMPETAELFQDRTAENEAIRETAKGLWQGAKEMSARKTAAGERANQIAPEVPDALARPHYDVSELVNNRGTRVEQNADPYGYALDAGRQLTEEQINRRMAADPAGRFLLMAGQKYLPGATLNIPERLGQKAAEAVGQEYKLGIRGLTPEEAEAVRDSWGGTVGGFAGQMGGYATTAGLAGAAVEGTAYGQQILNSKAAQWLAKQPWLQNAVTRRLAKQGIKATEDMILNEAAKFATRIGINAVTDIPMGVIQSHNQLMTDGVDFGSEEYWKGMATNTALDVFIGGLMDAGPVLWNAGGNVFGRSIDDILTSKGITNGAGEVAEEVTEAAARSAARNTDLPSASGRGISEVVEEAVPENTPKVRRRSGLAENQKINIPEDAPRLERKEDRFLRTLDAKDAQKLRDSVNAAHVRREGISDATKALGDDAERRANKQVRKLLRKSDMAKGMTDSEIDDFTKRTVDRAYTVFHDTGDVRGKGYSYEGIRGKLRSVDDSNVDEFISGLSDDVKTRVQSSKASEGLDILEKEARALPRPDDMTDEMYEAYIKDRTQQGYSILKEEANRPATSRNLDEFVEAPIEPDVVEEAVDIAPGTPAKSAATGTKGGRRRGTSKKTGGYTDEIIDFSGTREGGYSSKVDYHANKADANIQGNQTISEDTRNMYNLFRSETEHRSVSKAIENGTKRIEELGGMDKAYEWWNRLAGSNTRLQSDDFIAGVTLARQLDAAGKPFEAANVYGDLALMASDSGRLLQASNLLREMTPQGRKRAVLKMAQKISDANKGADVKVSRSLLDMLGNANSQKEVDMILDTIKIDLWNQIPLSAVEKLKNFRYLAMLSRPTTHIRNIIGNTIYTPARRVSDFFATAMEQARPEALRTRTFAKADKGLDELAQVFLDAEGGVLNANTRWNATRRPGEAMSFGSRPIGRALDKVSDAVGFSLEQGDVIFSEPVWKREFTNVIQARGYNAKTVTRELADEAAEIATYRALSATYRNANFISDALNKLADSSKVAGFFTDAIVPFRKTPSNIAIKAYNYSPLGLVTGAGRLVKAAADGNERAVTQAITQLAEGMTGSGVVWLGYFLGKNGILQPSLDTSTAEGKFRKEQGEQAYSVKIGDYTYTLDWAAPVSIPLFIGAEVAQMLGDDKDLTSLPGISEGFVNMMNPVFEMSMLSGLENALDIGRNSNTPGAVTFTKNVLKNYVGSYVPTIASGLANTLAPERKTTTSTAETPAEREWESYGRGLAQRIPGLNNLLEPYVNNLGERDTKSTPADYALSFAENFLSPGRLRKITDEPVTNELNNLIGQVGDEEGKSLIPPSTSDYTVKFGDEKMRMSESELTTFKENRGQYAMEHLNDLFNSPEYSRMTVDEKQEAVQGVYKDALRYAQDEFLKGRGVSQTDVAFSRLSSQTQAKYDPRTMKKDTFLAVYNTTKDHSTNNGKLMAAAEAGLSYDDLGYLYDFSEEKYWMAKYAVQQGLTTSQVEQISKACDADGNGSLRRDEVINYLDSQDLTQEQKMVLFDMLSTSKKNPYK